MPVLGIRDLATPLLDFASRRSDEVTAIGSLQPRDVLGTRHAAVHHPDAAREPEARLHRADDLLDSRHVHAIAVEDFVAQRNAFARDDERDAHLLAVRPMIATVSALGLRIAVGESLEV